MREFTARAAPPRAWAVVMSFPPQPGFLLRRVGDRRFFD
jgi:hypothetical protein